MSDALYDEESFSVFKRELDETLNNYTSSSRDTDKSEYSAFKRLWDETPENTINDNIVGLSLQYPIGVDFPMDGEDSVNIIADDRKNFIRELTKFSGGYINPAALPSDPFERQLSALPNMGDLDAKGKPKDAKADTKADDTKADDTQGFRKTFKDLGQDPDEIIDFLAKDFFDRASDIDNSLDVIRELNKVDLSAIPGERNAQRNLLIRQLHDYGIVVSKANATDEKVNALVDALKGLVDSGAINPENVDTLERAQDFTDTLFNRLSNGFVSSAEFLGRFRENLNAMGITIDALNSINVFEEGNDYLPTMASLLGVPLSKLSQYVNLGNVAVLQRAIAILHSRGVF